MVAKSFWAAKQGRDALKVEWDDSKAEKRSSAALMDEYRHLADQPALSARKDGDAEQAIKDAAHEVSASYEFPYLAHAPMEPLDAVVKLGRQQLRDLGGRSIPNRRPGERRAYRGLGSAASEHPHSLCRR